MAAQPHNAIIFVADGLRGAMVDPVLTPNMDALRREGVSFPNSHSLFPTVTTANASAIATGHYLGDTGNFANTVYAGFPISLPNGQSTVTPFLEDDNILGAMDAHFEGNYLTDVSLLALARDKGFSTAAIGKVGPTLIQDHTDRGGLATLVLDDRSGLIGEGGRLESIALSPEFAAGLKAAGLATTPPLSDRPNIAQQQYFVDVATKVLLPLFKKRAKPFVMVLWMRDPDTSQHYQLDSRYGLIPGINGSTSLAAIRNTDTNLGQLRTALASLRLADDTDLFVTADHGFSTISKQSESSQSLKCHYDDVPDGYLPPGFLGLDIAAALGLPLFDPDGNGARIGCETPAAGKSAAPVMPKHSRNGSALIGHDPKYPDIAVTAGAGSGLIYLTSDAGKAYTRVLVNFLLSQDYVGGVFLNDELGRLPGTVPMSAVGLMGQPRTPRPSMLVSFRSFSSGCEQPLRCGVEVADTNLGQGQGMHGSFSRSDTFNFMAAVGPDFRSRFVDPAPVSNADVAPTLARALGLSAASKGRLVGRVLDEALPGGKLPAYEARTCLFTPVELGQGPLLNEPPALHLQPALRVQNVGSVRYFDAAGLVGRTLGLDITGAQACSD